MALSIDHHIDNTDVGAFLEARERAAAIDGIELGAVHPQAPRPDGERDRFWQWVDDETPSTQIGSSLRRTALSCPLPGERVVAHADGPGRVVLERESDILVEFAGALTGIYTEGELGELRDEWR
ncbi:MAG TPA: hypothetical protein VJM33_09125 [Microthrixaceae bacterium]|nr:hypothetical protein [Microthrixaceae bacterium]